ncbi:MAG: DUF4263 domain-containing protein [Chitinophagaceae bacterium]|nr:DUF4263 domain-containing protein [Chitinophagaceae bacterium]MCW5925588.1 DUF4263 domain-containing protein [Chitinophagaceae bacterium]
MNWYDKIDNNFKRKTILEWTNLLDQNLTENHYHHYLSKNAGLFLGGENCHLVISKLKMGSELETDFITLTDDFSNGNQFELIEIKQPAVKLFTSKGLMTAEFNRAVQQIRDWKRWLIDNPSWSKKYLPTLSARVVFNSHLKFKIIIGRRLSNPFEIEKRNQIADEIGAEIRSFDYITDKFNLRDFSQAAWLETGKDFLADEVGNPFHRAVTDSQWKKFCTGRKVSTFHFYSRHSEDIIMFRKTF